MSPPPISANKKHGRARLNESTPGDYTRSQLLTLVHLAVYLSRLLEHRWLRLVGWDHSRLTALYNADALAKDGITLVEESFWDQGVKTFDRDFVPKTANLIINSWGDIGSIAKAAYRYAEYDEVVLIVNKTMLHEGQRNVTKTENDFGTSYVKEEYLCQYYKRSYYYPSLYRCLQSCDADPFV